MGEHKTVLEEAETLVCGERQQEYGAPAVCLQTTARLWAGYLRRKITPEQVAHLNLLQKIARARQRSQEGGAVHRDTLVDLAGYVRVIELLQEHPREVQTRPALDLTTRADLLGAAHPPQGSGR